MTRGRTYGARRRWARVSIIFAAYLSLAFSTSCLSHHGATVADVDPTGWSTPLVLKHINADTLSVREAALVVRYTAGAEGGIFVVEARSPSGSGARDTVEVRLAAVPAAGKIEELRLPYRTGVTLAEKGEYSFTIIPPAGMRGIWSAGIDLKRVY